MESAQEIDSCLIDWKGHNLAEKIAIRNPFLLIITTLVSILRMYCFHAKDIITAFCFYPLEGLLDRPKYPANTQSLLSLHAARRVAKTVNKKDSLS